jgi:hypothetical protein
MNADKTKNKNKGFGSICVHLRLSAANLVFGAGKTH